jgi:hypothetical protein
MPTTTSNQSTISSQKENLLDLCTVTGEVFCKFGILLRDLDICHQRSLSNNEQDQQLIGWDEQSAAMFRQAVQTFAISVRDISTVVAEKRIRER